MTPKACTVVVHDLNDTMHQLDPDDGDDSTKRSLRRSPSCVVTTGSATSEQGLTTVTVKVRNPEITHIVKVQDFENCLNRGCKSPADTVLKTRLREMLGMRKQ